MDRVKTEVKDHIGIVTFNRPEKMNALDPTQFRAIIEAGETMGSDSSVRVVVIKGEGKAFCAGLDIGALQTGNETTNDSLSTRTHGIANIWQ